MRWFSRSPLDRLGKAVARLESYHGEVAASPSEATPRSLSAAMADVARCRKTLESWGVDEAVLSRMWGAVGPLIADPVHDEAMRAAAIGLLIGILKNQSNRLSAALASDMLATLACLSASLAAPHLEQLIEVLSLLTRGGTWLAGASGILCADGDAAAVARCVAAWLQLLPSSDNERSRDVAAEGARPLLLRLLNALVRNNLLLLCTPASGGGGDGSGIVGQIVGAVCAMCEDMVLWRAAPPRGRAAPSAANNILTFCALEACVGARNTSLRGGVTLNATLPLVVRAVCFAIGVEFEPLWSAMRSLLLGSAAHRAMCALIDILDSPAQRRVAALANATFSAAGPLSARSSIASAPEAAVVADGAPVSARSPAPSRWRVSRAAAEEPSSRQVLLLRGAVFIVGMSCWGSARVESLEFRFASVLPSLRNALAIGSEVVAFEVVLSLQRLVRKYGAEMCSEWPTILGILGDALDLLHAPSSSAGARAHAAAAAARGGASDGAAGASHSSGEMPLDVSSGGAHEHAHRRHSSNDALATMLDGAASVPSPSTSVSRGAAASVAPESTDLLREVVAALLLIEELHRASVYAGSVDGLRRLQQRVKHRLPIDIVLSLLRWRAADMHPTYGDGVRPWLERLDSVLRDYLDSEHETRRAVRLEALEILHEAHWFARYDAEALGALIERVMIPRCGTLVDGGGANDSKLRLRALAMVAEVARQLHEHVGSAALLLAAGGAQPSRGASGGGGGESGAGMRSGAGRSPGTTPTRGGNGSVGPTKSVPGHDCFDALVAILERALRGEGDAASTSVAASSVTSLFLGTFMRPPGRHARTLYRVLVATLAKHPSRDVRATVLQCLASLRADRYGRFVHVGESSVRISTVLRVAVEGQRDAARGAARSALRARTSGAVDVSIELLVAALVQRLQLETDLELLLEEVDLLGAILQNVVLVDGLSALVKRLLVGAVSGCLALWIDSAHEGDARGDEEGDEEGNGRGLRASSASPFTADAFAWAGRALGNLGLRKSPSKGSRLGEGVGEDLSLPPPLVRTRSGVARGRALLPTANVPTEVVTAARAASSADRLRVLESLAEVAAGLLAFVTSTRDEVAESPAAAEAGGERAAESTAEKRAGGPPSEWMNVLLVTVLCACESLPALRIAEADVDESAMVECTTTMLRFLSIALHTVPSVALDYVSEILAVICATVVLGVHDGGGEALERISLEWLRALPRVPSVAALALLDGALRFTLLLPSATMQSARGSPPRSRSRCPPPALSL